MGQRAIITIKIVRFGSMCDTIYSNLQREHENIFLTKLTSQQFGGDVGGAAGAASRKRFMLFCER